MKFNSIVCAFLAFGFLASSAHAMVMNSESATQACAANQVARGPSRPCDGMTWLVVTTSSLPTIIVEGEEVDLQSPQAEERLNAEAKGDLPPVLSAQIAHAKGISVESQLVQSREHFGIRN